jgi:hypothetical protein
VDALRLQIARLEAYISDLEKRPKQRRTMEWLKFLNALFVQQK